MLASLEIQIDVARNVYISMGRRSLSSIEWDIPLSLQACLIKFGRVYSAGKVVVSPGEKRIIRGKVHSNNPGPGMVEVLDEFTERWMCYGS